MFVYHIYERLIDPRHYETVLNVICEDIGCGLQGIRLSRI